MEKNESRPKSMSLCGAYWHFAPDTQKIKEIISRNALSRELSTCLAAIGLDAGEEVEQFLHPKLEHLYDPRLMRNMDKAIARFQRAIEKCESIRVVTDYDVDGTMSSLILQGVLRICNHTKFSYHIPDRKLEGYGFTTIAAQKAIEDGVQLIVTADIGVRDEAAISLAQSHGIDVIVLDHHLPVGEGVPPSAYAVLCPPQAECNYPNKSLAACGISLKFAQAMLRNHPQYQAILRSMAKLAALGTVADVVSLRDRENRAIVSVGLDALNHDAHKPGLSALLHVSQVTPGNIDSSCIGYRIGPRINAAGRLASATLVVDLLHAPNSVIAYSLAGQLDAMNGDRQAIQEEMIRTAMACIGESEAPFIVIVRPESPEWHSGIAGIVAGRLREHYHRPVAVGTLDGCMITGSIRSTPGVHAVRALTSVESLLTKFGGHAAAAGFSCHVDHLDALIAGLCQNAVEQLHGESEIPVTEIALVLEPQQISPQLFVDLARLEPCGTQNPRPFVCIRDVTASGARMLKEKHLSLQIEGSGIPLRAIWFSSPLRPEELSGMRWNFVGELQKELWNGQIRYQLCIRDACRAGENVFV